MVNRPLDGADVDQMCSAEASRIEDADVLASQAINSTAVITIYNGVS